MMKLRHAATGALLAALALGMGKGCLLYTSDAADEGLGVDMGGGGVRKKKKNERREEKKKKQPLLIFIASTSLN